MRSAVVGYLVVGLTCGAAGAVYGLLVAGDVFPEGGWQVVPFLSVGFAASRFTWRWAVRA